MGCSEGSPAGDKKQHLCRWCSYSAFFLVSRRAPVRLTNELSPNHFLYLIARLAFFTDRSFARRIIIHHCFPTQFRLSLQALALTQRLSPPPVVVPTKIQFSNPVPQCRVYPQRAERQLSLIMGRKNKKGQNKNNQVASVTPEEVQSTVWNTFHSVHTGPILTTIGLPFSRPNSHHP